MTVYLIVYFITHKTKREVNEEYYDNSTFNHKSNEYIKSLPYPNKSSSNNSKKYVRCMKFCKFRIKHSILRKSFESFFDDEKRIKDLSKIDYSCIDNLPSIMSDDALNDARVVSIVRFMFSHSNYYFDESRLLHIVKSQNYSKTLTFQEIRYMKECSCYVLLEKLQFIYRELNTFIKMSRIARAYIKHPKLISKVKRYKDLIKSPLFISLCAQLVSVGDDELCKCFVNRIDEIYLLYSNTLYSFGRVLNYDFSRLYSPLEIYSKFEVFDSASENEKVNFLTLASKLSDKENIDEFMFAIRVEKMLNTVSRSKIKPKQINLLSSSIFIYIAKKNITMLCHALSSHYYMSLYFNKKRTRHRKSIINNLDYENTFEPIYKFNSINFAISTSNDLLHIIPNLPKNIERASFVVNHNKINHLIEIERGDNQELLLDNTKITGTSYIKLSNKPLKIKVIVSD